MKVRLVNIPLDELARYIGERIELEGLRVLRAEATLQRPNVLQVLVEHESFERLFPGVDVPWHEPFVNRWDVRNFDGKCSMCSCSLDPINRYQRPPHYNICESCYEATRPPPTKMPSGGTPCGGRG